MTKQDYALIASVITTELRSQHLTEREKTLVRKLVASLSATFTVHNASFNAPKFMEACKLPEFTP